VLIGRLHVEKVVGHQRTHVAVHDLFDGSVASWLQRRWRRADERDRSTDAGQVIVT
jgi:hypothetical protein